MVLGGARLTLATILNQYAGRSHENAVASTFTCGMIVHPEASRHYQKGARYGIV